jgi:hypothetical protein
MSIEDLLKPRYKVIADYPNTPFKVGEILQRKEGDWLNDKGWSKLYEPYPHLFKKLEWWEDRKLEYMPHFLKGKTRSYEILTWELDSEGEIFFTIEDDYLGWYPDQDDCIPITEEEYLQSKH